VLILALGYTFARQWGINGMAIAVALTIAITISIAIAKVRKSFGVQYRRTLLGPVTIFVITLAVAFALKVTGFCPPWCQMALAALVYAILTLRLEHGPMRQITRHLLKKKGETQETALGTA
jgi:quinol-cytochrome oxidoreductase complex cytochrome b subunit